MSTLSNIQLSPNFRLSEFLKSETASRKGIINIPNELHINNLKDVCKLVLQPIRVFTGAIDVTSGYRCTELCLAIGSSATSDHTEGIAVDFKLYRDVSMVDTVAFIIASGIPFDKMICEYWNKDDIHSGWIHIAYRPNGRKQLMIKEYKQPYSFITVDELKSKFQGQIR